MKQTWVFSSVEAQPIFAFVKLPHSTVCLAKVELALPLEPQRHKSQESWRYPSMFFREARVASKKQRRRRQRRRRTRLSARNTPLTPIGRRRAYCTPYLYSPSSSYSVSVLPLHSPLENTTHFGSQFPLKTMACQSITKATGGTYVHARRRTSTHAVCA